jgi:hypothetical protein
VSCHGVCSKPQLFERCMPPPQRRQGVRRQPGAISNLFGPPLCLCVRPLVVCVAPLQRTALLLPVATPFAYVTVFWLLCVGSSVFRYLIWILVTHQRTALLAVTCSGLKPLPRCSPAGLLLLHGSGWSHDIGPLKEPHTLREQCGSWGWLILVYYHTQQPCHKATHTVWVWPTQCVFQPHLQGSGAPH